METPGKTDPGPGPPDLSFSRALESKTNLGLGMWLNGRVLALHTQGPGFDQYQKRKKNNNSDMSFQLSIGETISNSCIK